MKRKEEGRTAIGAGRGRMSGGKKVLCTVLAAALVFGSLDLSGILSNVAEATETPLEMPTASTIWMMNKAETEAKNVSDYISKYNLAEYFKADSTTKTGVGIHYQMYNYNLKYAQLQSYQRNWSVTFTWDASSAQLEELKEKADAGEAKVNMGLKAPYDMVYFGQTSAAVATDLEKDSSCNLELGWKVDYDTTLTKPQMVMTGKTVDGRAEQGIWYVLADLVSPGENGWTYTVTTYEDEPTLWLCASETIRPANTSITASDLANMKLALTVVKKSDPKGDQTRVEAKAVALEACSSDAVGATGDGSAIGFQLTDEAEETLGNDEYQIVSIADASTDSSETLYVTYAGRTDYVSSGLTATTPLTDMAGNPVVLVSGETKNVYSQALYLDKKATTVDTVKLTGTNVDATMEMTTEADSWPEDIDRSKLFSKTGDTVQLSLQLSERVTIADADKSKIKLKLNLKNSSTSSDYVTASLTDVKDSYANGVNGAAVTTLTFSTVTITAGMVAQGTRIGAYQLVGGEYIVDLSGNQMAESGKTIDLSTNYPNVQNYLDTAGPNATLGTVTKTSAAAETATQTYQIEFTVKDGDTGTLAAGLVEDAQFALSLGSKDNITSQIEYSYTLTSASDTSKALSEGSGTAGASDSLIWNGITLPKEDSYYLTVTLKGLDSLEMVSGTDNAVLYLDLQDAVGNESTCDLTLSDVSVDNKAPELTLAAGTTTVSQTDGTNSAVFTATATASDANGIAKVEYVWAEGADAAEPTTDWKTDSTLTANATSGSVTFTSDSITAGEAEDQTVARTLYVRVTDPSGNATTTHLSMNAELSTATGRYRIEGDPDTPSDTTKILVQRPTSASETDSSGTAYSPSTMVKLTIGSNTYIRVVSSDTEENILDTSKNDWMTVTESDGIYTAVNTGVTPTWAYGPVTVTLTSSLYDLTPKENESVPTTTTDVTLHEDATITVKYAPENNEAYSVTFTGVQNNQAKTQVSETSTVTDSDSSTTTTYQYYKFDQSMTGVRYLFTLSNKAQSDWGISDIDFANSYAVLLKTDTSGNVVYKTDVDGSAADEYDKLDTTYFVTDKITLSNSVSQMISVPAVDKDDNALTTGAYTLLVHIAQKGGGSQDFYAHDAANGTTASQTTTDDDGNETTSTWQTAGYLLLDASSVPSNFGVFSYDRVSNVLGQQSKSSTSYGIECDVEESATALDQITVGYASGEDTTITSNGLTVATQRTVNSTVSGGLVTFKIKYTDEEKNDNSHAEWLGVTLGGIVGIRAWNAGSSGTVTASYPEFQNYNSTTVITGSGSTKVSSTVYDTINPIYRVNTVSGNQIVDDLSMTTVGDWKLTTGSNTICYQLKMENGTLSPVYQMQVNVNTYAPELELNFTPGNTYTANGKTYTDKMSVTLENVFSPNGDVTLYHATYDTSSGEWTYTEITDWTEPIKIASNQYLDGAGIAGTTGDDAKNPAVSGMSSSWIKEFFCAVDSTGNASVIYPEFKDDERKTDYYGVGTSLNGSFYAIWGDPTTVDLYNGTKEDALYTSSYTVTGYLYDYDDWQNTPNIKDNISKITISIDGGDPVTVYSDGSSGTAITPGSDVNKAGVYDVSWNDDNSKIYISFVMPYDETAAEYDGTDGTASHEVSIAAYGKLGETYNNNTTYTAPNIKPQVRVSGRNDAGGVSLNYNELLLFDLDEAGGFKTAFSTTTDEDESEIVTANTFDVDTKEIYKNGTYTISFQDVYGNTYDQEITVDCFDKANDDLYVEFSTMEPTAQPVTMTVTAADNTLTGCTLGSSSNSYKLSEDGKSLTATFNENDEVKITYEDAAGTSYSLTFTVDNITTAAAISPQVVWGYSDEQVQEVDGEKVIYGEVTAHLVDANGGTLVDPETGEVPSYVFYPGGETSYTFTGYTDSLGTAGPDVTATLPVKLLLEEKTKTDTYGPSLGITGYRVYDGKPEQITTAYTKLTDGQPEEGTSLKDYSEFYETVTSSIKTFTSKFEWANSYKFKVDVGDQSAVKLFVKTSTKGGAPKYADGESDTIEGVTLAGRSLTITENCSFVLYAVDEYDNATAVPFEITELGDTPVPNYAVVLMAEKDEARFYLLPPNVADGDLSDLAIVTTDTDQTAANETDESSAFKGYDYLSFSDNNEEATLNYSFRFKGKVVTGKLTAEVVGIDKTQFSLSDDEDNIIWSANKDLEATNQDVSVQITFNKSVGAVELLYTDSEDPLSNDDYAKVKISWLDNHATIVFTENIAKELTLKAESVAQVKSNGEVDEEKNSCGFALGAVTNIDKVAPTCSASVTYAGNHRSATVTISGDENIAFVDSGKEPTSTSVTTTIKADDASANGTYTYTVADLAGNETTVTAEVTELVGALELKAYSDADGETAIAAEDFELEVGSTIYVKVNRSATLTVTGNDEKITANADTLTEIEINEDAAGLYPIILATDGYGNTASLHVTKVAMPDKTAPVLTLVKQQLVLASGTDKAALEEALKANVTVSDDISAAEDITIAVAYGSMKTGERQTVTYTATDEAGNAVIRTGYFKIQSDSEPLVTVNGDAVAWEDILLLDAEEAASAEIVVTTNGERYKMGYRSGKKTVAQMKRGQTVLTKYTTDKEKTLTVELTDSGYYTFLLQTQGRQYYRFVIYVKEQKG